MTSWKVLDENVALSFPSGQPAPIGVGFPVGVWLGGGPGTHMWLPTLEPRGLTHRAFQPRVVAGMPWGAALHGGEERRFSWGPLAGSDSPSLRTVASLFQRPSEFSSSFLA